MDSSGPTIMVASISAILGRLELRAHGGHLSRGWWAAARGEEPEAHCSFFGESQHRMRQHEKSM
jgi:hypothetical protein